MRVGGALGGDVGMGLALTFVPLEALCPLTLLVHLDLLLCLCLQGLVAQCLPL